MRTSAISICHQLRAPMIEKTTSLPMASVDWLPSRLLSSKSLSLNSAASHMAMGKVHSVPDGSKELHDSLDSVAREVAKLQEANGDGHIADEDILAVVDKERQSYNARLISSASTRQYESATLPARQMGQDVRDAPFSEKQQRQSRYDGGLEEDGVTTRALVPIVLAELCLQEGGARCIFVDAAEPPTSSDDAHLAGEECRGARDGQSYTLKEFKQFYGDERGTHFWNSADIHRAGVATECEAAAATNIFAHYRDDHNLYMYDRTTFSNPDYDPRSDSRITIRRCRATGSIHFRP